VGASRSFIKIAVAATPPITAAMTIAPQRVATPNTR